MIDGTDREGQVEVVDVSQLLLESVSRDGLPEPREAEWLEKPRREKKASEIEAEREAAEKEKAEKEAAEKSDQKADDEATATAATEAPEKAPDNAVTDKGDGA